MIRTVLAFIATAICSLTLAPVVALARLCGVRDRKGSIYERAMVVWARTVLFAAGARQRVFGAEHIAPDGGVVYVSNHVSWFDVFAVAATFPRASFVAKH